MIHADVSVLLPVRDAEHTIGPALRSLQAQRSVSFECLVVDDGSEDQTSNEIQNVVANDPRFRVLRQERRGIVAALTHAVAQSRSPILARQDADDESHPQRLCDQLAFLKANPTAGLVATQVEVRSASPLTAGHRRYLEWLAEVTTSEQIAHALWIESPLPHPTVMFRREVYERAGGYRDNGWPEDYDLWLRMRRHEVRMAKLSKPLYTWSDHPRRASRVLPQYGRDRFLECRAHHLSAFLEGQPVEIWGAGREGKRFARAFLREGGTVLRFIDVDPRKIGNTAQGRPVVGADHWSPEPGAILLVSVGAAGARDLVRGRLEKLGLREGIDFLCVA